MKDKVISFPQLGDYAYFIKYLFDKLTNYKIVLSPKITKKTIEIGSKESPNNVCLPFKYNLGNFIESLEMGANVLFQFGGGCRYGYYCELQEQILKDMGYNFSIIQLIDKGKVRVKRIYKIFKELNSKLNIFNFIYRFLIVFLMIFFMDKQDHFIRKNIGFEVYNKSFLNLKKIMIDDFYNNKGIIHLIYLRIKYKILFSKILINKPKDVLKVGIIGELYTSMEPFSSYNLEYELARFNVEVKRFTNVSYLLVFKWILKPFLKFKVRNHLRFSIGADGMDNVYRTKYLINNGYDGIIHIKPFGCTPEIGAIPIISKICSDSKMPIIFFSFDTMTSEVGIKTRLEAFYDMLVMKRENYYE